MRHAVLAMLAVGLALVLAASLELGSLERSGPFRTDLELAGGIPATLYLPQPADPAGPWLPSPPPADARPAALVLLHGFSSDRVMMSTLARRLATSGYAVLAPDLHGHGANRNPFPAGTGRTDAHFDDVAAAVSFLRTSPYVDGSRLVVMGHSMGATAALDFATRDSGIDGVVAISGGRVLTGPFPPPNALWIWAAGDPESLRAGAFALARQVAGDASLALGATHGEIANGRGVRAVEIPDTDHLSVIFSSAAAREIVAWLDGIFGVPPRAELTLDEPRLPALGLALLGFVLCLPGVGWLSGRLARRLPERAGVGGLAGLAAIAVALGVTLPLLAVGAPLGFVSLEVGDPIGSLLFAAGLAALASLAAAGWLSSGMRPIGAGFVVELRAALAPGLAGFAAIYLLSLPIGAVGHRMVPTPERAVAAVALAALVLPYFLAKELLVRRGGVVLAAALGLGARALLVGALILGVSTGVLPPVVGLMVPLFVPFAVAVEIVATAVYATSRNLLVVSVLETAWFAWIIAALMPIRA